MVGPLTEHEINLKKIAADQAKNIISKFANSKAFSGTCVLAEKLDLTPSTVRSWVRHSGRGIPVIYWQKIIDASEGRVTKEDFLKPVFRD